MNKWQPFGSSLAIQDGISLPIARIAIDTNKVPMVNVKERDGDARRIGKSTRH